MKKIQLKIRTQKAERDLKVKRTHTHTQKSLPKFTIDFIWCRSTVTVFPIGMLKLHVHCDTRINTQCTYGRWFIYNNASELLSLLLCSSRSLLLLFGCEFVFFF